MADLPTNLKDDILDSSVNTRRKYRMIENGDGTYSFEDLTEYNQVGDEYGAGLINETNRQVNARVEKAVIVRDLETIGAITQPGFIPDALAVKDVNRSLGGLSFGTDGDGNYGYYGADGSLIPFKGYTRSAWFYQPSTSSNVTSFSISFTVPNNCVNAIMLILSDRQGQHDNPILSDNVEIIETMVDSGSFQGMYSYSNRLPIIYRVKLTPNSTVEINQSYTGSSNNRSINVGLWY